MKLQEIPISKIIVKDRFREEKGDLDELAATIKAKGIIQPLTVDDKFKLLCGERRLLAAKLAGLTKVPVIVRTVGGKVDALELELIENTARKDMEWPERAKLTKRIFDMKKDHDPKYTQREHAEVMGESLGSVTRRLYLADALETLPDLTEFEREDDAYKDARKLEERFMSDALRAKAPEDVKQAAKWAETHYRVGDAFEGMADLDDGCAGFAEVDPPYGVALQRRKGRNKGADNMDDYNEIPDKEYPKFFQTVAEEVYRVLRPDTFAIFWYGPSWHTEVLAILKDAGFSVPDIPAVWTKGSVGQTASPDTTLGSCYEPFWLARKGSPKLHKPGRSNVFSYSPIAPSKKIHPTEKPFELMVEILDTCLVYPGSNMIVPFLGSGVTLRAAYHIGHTGWGYDLSEDHKKAFLNAVYADVQLMSGDKEDDDTV